MASIAQPAADRERYRFSLPFVIGASAAGTTIEWYDFYLYGVLAVFFSEHFFPRGMTSRRCSPRSPRSGRASPFDHLAPSSSDASATWSDASSRSC